MLKKYFHLKSNAVYNSSAKNQKISENANYIHADGTPCRSAKKRANELPDLPPMNTQPSDSNLDRLPVVTDLIENSLENNSNCDTAESTNQTEDGDIPVKTRTNEKHDEQIFGNGSESHPGLTVETGTNENHDDQILGIENESLSGLTVETNMQTDSDVTPQPQPTSDLTVETSNQNKPTESPDETSTQACSMRLESMLNEANREAVDRDDSTVSEVALGLMMLNDSVENDLLQKYDNSALLPVNATKCEDHGKKPVTEENVTNSDADKDNDYDSDDTIILQQEIEDTIGMTRSKLPTTNSQAPANISANENENGLPVVTQGTDSVLDTTVITKELSNLTVTNSPARATIETPVSPNRGTVIFKSYRLCRYTTDSNNTSGEVTSNKQLVENDIQLAKIPSGNSTRPPPPDKYKIKKIQIDKVRYYSCLYHNKHFESLRYLNKHHRRNHPPVSCDVCSRTYDTPNSLIRHSYTHLSGNHQCDQCQESFHFKSELESHKNIYSNRRFQCNKCDRSFIWNSDLNTHLDTHGEKWKCPFKGCTKECADKRYLSTHMKIHSNKLKYQCRKCNRRFCFYEQRKWHETDHP